MYLIINGNSANKLPLNSISRTIDFNNAPSSYTMNVSLNSAVTGTNINFIAGLTDITHLQIETVEGEQELTWTLSNINAHVNYLSESVYPNSHDVSMSLNIQI